MKEQGIAISLIIKVDEAYRPIRFYDLGAFVWSVRILGWEFTNFSVGKCFAFLFKMQEAIDENGKIEGTIFR